MKWHQLNDADSKRITCSESKDFMCRQQATLCQHREWDTGNTKGVSFYYFCERHATKRGYKKGDCAQ